MMSELERLTEDLRAYDASMGLIRKRYPELDHVQPTPAIVEAARAYRDLLANGQRVEWCEVHNHEAGPQFVPSSLLISDECWQQVWSDGYDTVNPFCRTVSKLLSVYPKEAETVSGEGE